MSNTLKYRADIDGLRAIAVLLVLFFHTGFSNIFPAGYIGVDVFFVISGFLITNIIYKEAALEKFKFSRFYLRRIKRLMPAYLTVTFSTSLFALYQFLPEDLISYFKSLISTVIFISNFYMWKVAGGYFASNSDTIPLLHTWSLAVEEQFYFIWPICILIAVKLFKEHKIIWATFFATLLTLALSQWGAVNYPSVAYYLIPTRAFELLIGALLAVSYSKLKIENNVLTNALGLLGLFLIFIPAVYLDHNSYFPGLNALYPCLGSALLIYTGKNSQAFITKLLSIKVFVFIGLISYPLYLWHWPITAFVNYRQIEMGYFISSAVIIFSILLSYLTYKYIEIPVRKLKELSFKRVFTYLWLVPSVLLVGISLITISKEGFPDRFSKELQLKNKATSSWAHIYRGRCNEGNPTSPLSQDKCRLGVKNKESVDILLVGDSHANHFTGMIDVMATGAGLRGYDITQSQTPFLVDANMTYAKSDNLITHKNFLPRNKKLINIIKKSKYKYVVMAGALQSYGKKSIKFYLTDSKNRDFDAQTTIKVLLNSFSKSIQVIHNSGAAAVIIKETPHMGTDKSRCTINNELFLLNKSCHISRNTTKSDQKIINNIYQALLKKHPKLIFIDPKELSCNSDVCLTELNGVPLYKDAGHFNDTGSRLIGTQYIKKYGNPFIKK